MTGRVTARQRNWSLGLLFTAYTINIFDRQIINVLAQDIKVELRISDAQLGMLTGTAFGICYALLGIPLGRLADRVNRIRLMTAALVIWSGFTVFSGLAANYFQLFLARVGVGVGEAGCLPAGTSLIPDLFPEGRRTSAMSLMLSGATVGSFLGLLVGGYVDSIWGWHAAFVVAGIPGLLLAAVIAVTMRETRPPSRLITPAQPTRENTSSLAAALLTLVRRPGFMWLMLGGMCSVFLVYVSGAWLPAFFIRQYGMSTAEIGRFAALAVGLGGITGTLGAGALCDLLRPRVHEVESKAMMISLALVVPTFLTTLLASDRSVALGSMFLFDICAFSFLAPSARLTQLAATPDTQGVAIAAGTLASIPNLAFGLPLVGAISDLLTPAYGREAIRYALATCSVAAVVGVIAHWRAWRALRAARSNAPEATRNSDPLVEGFLTPPNVATPRVWWHWMGGNVTLEGIRLDVEWMQRIGIGGITNIDAAFEGWSTTFDTPRRVEKPVIYLSRAWQQAIRYSVDLASGAGMEFSIDSSPGFSQTGGPWVQPHQGMKKLVWSETVVQGGVPFKGRLAQPPGTTGAFQNIPLVNWRARGGLTPQTPTYYADVSTIAYRAPDSEIPFATLKPNIRTRSGPIEGTLLYDGDLANAVSIPFGADPHEWIEFFFPEPQRIQGITIVLTRPASLDPLRIVNPSGWLEASDDGHSFRKIVDLPRNGALQQTASFAPVIARVFRVVLGRPEPSVFERAGLMDSPATHHIAQLVLHTAARVHRFEDKAGYSVRQITGQECTPDVPIADVVHRSDIIDLTCQVGTDGSLTWTPPPGRWIVLRFGYSLTGRTNLPESPAATGLEVDKLNRTHVKAYLDAYLSEYENALGRELMGQRGLQSVVTDSYEAGPQNWTDDMLEQFRDRRGYDALSWLPVLAGRVVESATSSERFLWDFRKTLSELLAEAHYGQISSSVKARGLALYSESHEHGRAFIGDGMAVKKYSDIPMGAMWAARVTGRTQENYDTDIRESASVAHIYGKPLVAAESFTALGNTYGFSPQDLKPIADRALALGVNRVVIANSVHQPDNQPGPGIGLGPFGLWFTRHETWAEQSTGWIAYLSRSCYLLQQGRFVADIAYLYGEDTNLTCLFNTNYPSIPAGYNFDFVNPDTLLHEFSVKDGRIVTRAGMEYRLLALDESTRRLSLPVLHQLRNLVREGARVVGARPTTTLSLTDDEATFRAIVAEIWDRPPCTQGAGSHQIVSDRSLADALLEMQIQPDVSFANSPDAELRFVHRALEDGDLYFISSGTAHAVTVDASFRVGGKVPELWRADTGAITALSYRVENGRTIVPLKLEAHDAVFVVFRRSTTVPSVTIQEPEGGLLVSLQGPWDVSFPPDLGAPAHIQLDSLSSWTDSMDPGVKYFSGTATYDKTVSIPDRWLHAGSKIQLDLGEVKCLAEILINGRSLGILWNSPFRSDITAALQPGLNRIEIRVTNLWPNRLIGDQQPGAQPIAFASFDPFKADSPLLPSGLLGPVTLWGIQAAAEAR